MFDRLTKIFIVFLPFYVLFKVFFEFKLGIPYLSFVKELFIVILLGIMSYEFYKQKKLPKFDKLDYLIFAYILYLSLATLFAPQFLASFIYGARYDFEFLLVFLIFKHSNQFLKNDLRYYVGLFLTSGARALIIGFLAKFIGEGILTYLGFGENVNNWQVGGTIPIYQGVEGTGIYRFQGIFDGPNQAAFFLLTYIGFLFYYFKGQKDYYFLLGFLSVFLVPLFIYTFSRSALLGVIIGTIFVFTLNINHFFKKHKKQTIKFIIIFLVFIAGFGFLIKDKVEDVVVRKSSTTGHAERMTIGINRFISYPLGQGLASSGPASRYTHNIEGKKQEDFYIPESWFIQQLVEGGLIGFVLFVSIMSILFFFLLNIDFVLAVMFFAVMMMNLFLHTFEASYVSILFFILIAILYSKKE
ncbi:MAG: O-antigen ligase family protein [Candidatus Gracilibacteria bacterium]|nr:O-antigen ligase family protein [Candidatus Gracilibacteria bacterium]